MKALGSIIVFVICFAIVAGVVIHLWPDAQPLIQNITGGDPSSLLKSFVP